MAPIVSGLADRRGDDAGQVAGLVFLVAELDVVRQLGTRGGRTLVDADEPDVGVHLGDAARRRAVREAGRDDDVEALVDELLDVRDAVRGRRRGDERDVAGDAERLGGLGRALVGVLIEVLVVDLADVGCDADLGLRLVRRQRPRVARVLGRARRTGPGSPTERRRGARRSSRPPSYRRSGRWTGPRTATSPRERIRMCPPQFRGPASGAGSGPRIAKTSERRPVTRASPLPGIVATGRVTGKRRPTNAFEAG